MGAGAPRRDVARMQVNPPPELLCPRACLHQSVQPTLGRALPGHGAGSSIGDPEPADEQALSDPTAADSDPTRIRKLKEKVRSDPGK